MPGSHGRLCCGSSPHTRGTLGNQTQRDLTPRFIPTYAGNAPVPAGSRVLLSVHPRMRGERPGSIHESPVLAGSSPHTRGTSCRGQGSRAGRRFIPAYAGNAASSALRRSCAAVHPRIRGERSVAPCQGSVSSGSSPHTRGTHRRADRIAQHHRFIPAYAGNAARLRPLAVFDPVHPRIRGERSCSR